MEKKEAIKDMANWCLNCPTKPCTNGCPMNTEIPEFINFIKAEDYKSAYEILQKNNFLSYICSKVCPQEDQCEGKCIRGIKQTPTEIGKLEMFVNEWARENNIVFNREKKSKNGKSIAIVGAGPAGLYVANELLLEGFDVTIFEREEKLGGILTYGIPDFRLDKKLVDEIVEKLISLGLNVKNNCSLGNDISIKQLKEEYDFVFLGIGATESTTYKLSEKNVQNVYKSDEFLKKYNTGNYIKSLGKVVVIGGGNVAIDSARAAVHMGAEKVSILYRRDEENMPARKIEIEEALEDGVEILYKTRVIDANVNNEKMISLNCIKTQIIDKKAVDIENSEFTFEADSVIFAIGLKPNKNMLQVENIKLNEWGMVETDENGHVCDNIYAGGDVIESKSTVCRAIASSKKAVKAIVKSV